MFFNSNYIMGNVLHFDHDPTLTRIYIDEIAIRLHEIPYVNYEYFQTVYKSFLRYRKELEEKLIYQDVFLVHPGVEGQNIVLGEYPNKFPKLKIGILTCVYDDYFKGTHNIEVLDYSRIDDIVSLIRQNNLQYI